MSATVTLTVTLGQLQGAEFRFDAEGTWVVGRSPECDLRVPNSQNFATTSRRHCQFTIDPPFVWVRDLGSRNGTFINGHRIHRLDDSQTPQQVFEMESPDFPLSSGDEVRIGGTVLRITVSTAGVDVSDPVLTESALQMLTSGGDLVRVPLDDSAEPGREDMTTLRPEGSNGQPVLA